MRIYMVDLDKKVIPKDPLFIYDSSKVFSRPIY